MKSWCVSASRAGLTGQPGGEQRVRKCGAVVEYQNVALFSVIPALSSKKFNVRNVFIAKKFDTHKVCWKSSIFIVKLSTGMYETLFDTLINQSCVIHCCLLLIVMSFLFRMLCWCKLMLLTSLYSSECCALVVDEFILCRMLYWSKFLLLICFQFRMTSPFFRMTTFCSCCWWVITSWILCICFCRCC